jgi:signal transduction histidine kinase
MNRLSLRHTLLAVISGLTALVLVLTVLFAHREVSRTETLVVEERLTRVVEQIAELASATAEQRLRTKERAGREPAILAMLSGQRVDDEALLHAIAPLRTPADSALPIEIRDAHGRTVFTDMPDARLPELRYERPVPLDTLPAYGHFFVHGSEVQYFSTSPVLDAGEPIGWIVQRRRIGNPRNAFEIQQLIGSNARVLFSYPGDSLWITLAGEPVRAPLRRPADDSTLRFADAAGERFLARATPIRDTPWRVLIEMPEAVVGAGSRRFLERLVPIGFALILVAVVIAWLLSRRLTRPLRELAVAADAVASGDYSRRVEASPDGNELDRVATAFNSMAEQVAATHEALQTQLEEARALARELEALNAEAERARSAAQAADRAKSEFLATMSHEIRTPINAVLGFCELLEIDSLGEEARRDYLQRTRRAAKQLAALVNDVLDLAKVDAGEIRIRAEARAASDTIKGVLALLGDEVSRKRLDVAVELDASLDYLADPQRVEQILLNLLGNAVKFTPEDGRIRVRGVVMDADESARLPGRHSAWVRIDVEDTGIGIDADELDRIFEPFVQAQTGYTREYGGTGLGLSISRRLARLMDGDIRAESRPGEGSRFTLLLPIAAQAAHARA